MLVAICHVFLVVLCVLLPQPSHPFCTRGQVATTDLFDAVPPESRTEVKEAVAKIVDLYQRRQWDRVYDLLGEHKASRDEFVKESRHPWTLVKFSPSQVQQLNARDVDWVVSGCALVKWQGREENWEAFMNISIRSGAKSVRLLIAAKKHDVGPITCGTR